MIASLGQDLRFALRTLRRSPGFTLAAISVLALGIGANTAIFSAANAFFFRPLPFEDPDELVVLYETNPEFGWTDVTAAPANVLDWREGVDAFRDVAAYREVGVEKVAIQGGGEPVAVGGTTVTGNLFTVLGVRPHLGRGFTWEETWAGSDDVVILSHALWVSRFGADPDVIGSTIQLGSDDLEDAPREVVGVMPEGFSFPHDATQLWYPYGWEPAARSEAWFRRAHYVRAVARLEAGASREEADAQLQAVVARLQEEHPETNRVMGAGFMPVRDFLTREVRTPVLVLLGAVALLLLLACANVANLLLVRTSARSRELALRHALGAGRGRVARQVFMESLLLALGGSAFGLLLGWVGVRAMTAVTRIGIDGATTIALDGRVLAFVGTAAGLSAVLFGLAPVVRSFHGDVRGALGERGRGHSGGRRVRKAARVLVAAEVTLALVLVVGAGLMVRSFWGLRSEHPGFQVDDVLAVELILPEARYEERDQVLALWDRLAEALAARPEIVDVGTVEQLPLTGTSWTSQFQAEGWEPERVGFEIVHRRADTGYFEALDIPLVRGRLFQPTDRADAPPVVVINEAFAREHFPAEDPIGQRIAYTRNATPESTWYEIVGIVGDQRQVSPRVPARPEVFENRSQDWSRSAWVVVETASAPLEALPTLRSVVAELDPELPIAEARTLREVWSASLESEEFVLILLGIFGAVALLLATVGVYGVTAQAARQRTREIGIRVAMGAGVDDVVGLMLREGLTVLAVGVGVGLGVSLLSTRALSSLVYGVEPTDPATLVSVTLLLVGVTLLACWVPARRAAAADPVDSLRAE